MVAKSRSDNIRVPESKALKCNKRNLERSKNNNLKSDGRSCIRSGDMVFLPAQLLFSHTVAFSLSALETSGRMWGREGQSTIPHAAPASDGRICSAKPHDCQVRVRTSFPLLSTGLGRLHRIWPFAASGDAFYASSLSNRKNH